MYRYVINISPDGHEVYVDLISSAAGHYLSRQPYVIGLIKEVLTPMKFTQTLIFIEQDMGRVIGNTDIISTSEKDAIFYAQANRKTVFSRYAKNRYPSPSQKLSIILRQDPEGNYEVCDTWIGPCSPPFPGDNDETAASKPYWQTHALVPDTKAMQLKTITKTCPY